MTLSLKEKKDLMKRQQEELKNKKEDKASHPPIAPKPEKKPKTPETIELSELEKIDLDGSEFFFDWDYLSKNSSFQRGFQEFMIHTFGFLKGIDPRLSKKKLEQSFKARSEKINEAVITTKIVGKDQELLREIKSSPLFLAQQLKNNPGKKPTGSIELSKLNKPK